MAKKIQIDIEVNGKMQKATLSAKKLNQALDGTSKSAREADRNIKGVAQASANGAKNFSKMSQGMGGLVGAYAALAASLFAVSAAFNFLKRAGELKSLQAGQVAYASATGTSLSALTENIIQATNAQIAFRDAAQAAAIGTAAGLGADQLERLGKAAADASQVLGRDVTDSFNRLIRGVTKAEPELLDELGIILRLENATELYATSLNKNAKELTAFERSQAVANDVLAQAEDKYGRILDITGRSPNQYAQLGKAFDDLVMKVQSVVDVVAGPLAKVLQDTPALAIASFLLLLKGPLAALGINFQEMAINASDAASKQVKALQAVKLEASRAAKSVKVLKAEFAAQAGAAAALNTDSQVLKRASLGTMKGADFANLDKALKSAEAQYAAHKRITTGIFKGMSIEMVRSINGAFLEMQRAQDVTVSKTKVATTQMKLMYTQVATFIKSAGAAILNFGTKILRFAGWVGFAVTIYQVFKDLLFGTEEATDAASTALERQRKTIQKVTEDLEHFAEIQGILAENSKSLSGFGNIGNALGNLTGDTLTTAIGDLQEFEQMQDRIDKQQEGIARRQQSVRDTFGSFIGGAINALGELGMSTIGERFGLLAQSEEAEKAKQLFGEIAGAITAVEQETGRSMVTFTKLKEMLANPEQYPIETIEAYILRAQDLGKQLSEYPRIAQTASQSLLSFKNSIAPISAAQQTINDLQAQIDAIFAPAEQGETFLTQEEIDKMNQLKDQVKLIADFRDRAHRAAMRQLATQLKITNEVVGESQAAQAVREAQNAVVQNSDKQLDIQEKIKDIVLTKRGLAGQLTAEDIQQLEILGAQLAIEQKIAGILQQKLALEKELKPLRDSQTAAQVEDRRLQSLQQLVGLEQKKMGYVKEQADALEKVLNARLDRILMSARSEGGFIDPRKEQEARIKLEEHLVKLKTAQINREYKMKMTTLALEEQQLKVKNRLAKIQYQIAVKENPELADQATLAMFDAIDKSISETARLGRETAAITKNAALETVDLTLDKMKQAFEDMSLQGQMANAFESGFRDGLNNALSGLISGDMSFKEALKSFADTLLNAMVTKLQSILVDAIMQGIFGPEEDPAEKMERVLKEEKLSKNVGTAIEQKGKELVTGIENALSSTVENQVKVQCCDLNTPDPVVVNNSKEIARDIAEATQPTDAQKLVQMVGAVVVGMMGGKKSNDEMGGESKFKTLGLKILAAPFALIAKGFQKLFGKLGSHLYDARTGKYLGDVDNNMRSGIAGPPNARFRADEAADAVRSGNVISAEGRAGGFFEKLKYILTYPFMIMQKFMRGEIDRDMTKGIAGPPRPGTDMRQDETGIFGNIFTYVEKFFGKIGDGASNLFGWFKGLFGDKKDTNGMNLLAFAKDVLGSSEGEGSGIMGMVMKLFSMIQRFFGMMGGQGGGDGGMFGGDFLGTIAGFFGFGGARYGGIMEPPKGYRSGGIATGPSRGYPAMLHGKEAVVPLPHGNKIPVEIKGSSGQQNNIGITVNIASDGTTSTSEQDKSDNEGKNLARAISAVVQEELIKQRRAGGMLSPYGA